MKKILLVALLLLLPAHSSAQAPSCSFANRALNRVLAQLRIFGSQLESSRKKESAILKIVEKRKASYLREIARIDKQLFASTNQISHILQVPWDTQFQSRVLSLSESNMEEFINPIFRYTFGNRPDEEMAQKRYDYKYSKFKMNVWERVRKTHQLFDRLLEVDSKVTALGRGEYDFKTMTQLSKVRTRIALLQPKVTQLLGEKGTYEGQLAGCRL